MPIVSNPKGGIEIEVLWSDQHVVECQVRCSNGRFSGTVEIYLGHDDLPRIDASAVIDRKDDRSSDSGARIISSKKGGR